MVSDYGSDLQEENDKKDWAINKPIRYIEKGRKILDGEESITDIFKGGLNGKIFDKLSDSKLGDWARNNPTMQKAKEKFDVGEEFLRQGGFKDLHKGFNEVRDTFFVSPGGGSNAPKDWQNTQNELESRQKAKNEKHKDMVVNNKGMLEFVIKEDGLIKKYEDKYKGQNKSPEYIRDKAEGEAKQKLGSLCDTYMPLGIRDPKLMYSLDKDRKEYGLSPKEAIIERAEYEKFFEKFNLNSQANKVTDVIPEDVIRKCFYAGHRNVDQISNPYYISQKLTVSLEKALQICEVGKRKGNVDYKGEDVKMKEAFNEINARLFRQN